MGEDIVHPPQLADGFAQFPRGLEHDLTHRPRGRMHAPDPVERETRRRRLDGVEHVIEISGQFLHRLRAGGADPAGRRRLEEIAGNRVALVLQVADDLPRLRRRDPAVERRSQRLGGVLDRPGHLFEQLGLLIGVDGGGGTCDRPVRSSIVCHRSTCLLGAGLRTTRAPGGRTKGNMITNFVRPRQGLLLCASPGGGNTGHRGAFPG